MVSIPQLLTLMYMKVPQKKIRILFFIGSLRAGGKERRLVELLTYLKRQGSYEMLVLATSEYIHYESFFELGIPYRVLPKMCPRYDPSVVFQFYKFSRQFKPDVIHTWGQMQSFYALPTVLLERVPLINSQITSAPPSVNNFSLSYALDRLIFAMSSVILSNSMAGLKSFNPPKQKSKVIYNGLNIGRFENLPDVWDVRAKYGINTRYALVMVASVSPNKDYVTFFKVARLVTAIRQDITFLSVGGYLEDDPLYLQIKEITKGQSRLHFKGNISDVEALVNACDIGMLLSPNGEGISNAILEYMALGKPVIASNKGGTPEIIEHGTNGFLVQNSDSAEDIASYVIELLDNEDMRRQFGEKSRKMIEENFAIDKMGKAFEQVYNRSLLLKQNLISNRQVCRADNEAMKL